MSLTATAGASPLSFPSSHPTPHPTSHGATLCMQTQRVVCMPKPTFPYFDRQEAPLASQLQWLTFTPVVCILVSLAAPPYHVSLLVWRRRQVRSRRVWHTRRTTARRAASSTCRAAPLGLSSTSASRTEFWPSASTSASSTSSTRSRVLLTLRTPSLYPCLSRAHTHSLSVCRCPCLAFHACRTRQRSTMPL